MSSPDDWRLVSSQGAALFFIVVRPGCTTNEIAEGLGLTERSIWNLVVDLRRAGMLRIRREGHRYHYTVNLDALFELPTSGKFPLRVLVGRLAEEVSRQADRPAQVA